MPPQSLFGKKMVLLARKLMVLSSRKLNVHLLKFLLHFYPLTLYETSYIVRF